MRICFIANVNSKTCQNWISYFLSVKRNNDYEVHIISPYPPVGPIELNGANLHVVSLFGRRGYSFQDEISAANCNQTFISKNWSIFKVRLMQLSRTLATEWWAQLRLLMLRKCIAETLAKINPDLVHALRLVQEGEMAGLGGWRPLIISVWGQDLILDAQRSVIHRWLARNALFNADAVIADNKRDLELAYDWGRRPGTLGELMLSSGGIRTDIFYPGEPDRSLISELELEDSAVVILSPRGLRPGYIRLRTLFEAIPRVVDVCPEAKFVQLEIPSETIAYSYGLSKRAVTHVRLLKRTNQKTLAEIMRRSTLMVSPATKDGTPNSFFESMACGVVPIVPSISPYTEWITNGKNGMFFDPYSPESLAKAVTQAINDNDFLAKAKVENFKIVDKIASRDKAMEKAEVLYNSVVVAFTQS